MASSQVVGIADIIAEHLRPIYRHEHNKNTLLKPLPVPLRCISNGRHDLLAGRPDVAVVSLFLLQSWRTSPGD
jgi:hypothetical protein